MKDSNDKHNEQRPWTYQNSDLKLDISMNHHKKGFHLSALLPSRGGDKVEGMQIGLVACR